MFLTPVVRNLLLINAGFLFVPMLTGHLDEINDLLGLHSIYSPQFSAFQLLSYMFLHGGFTHLLFNMMGLVFFGSWLERSWGAQRFLIFYIICGIGAGLLYEFINWYEMRDLMAAREAFLLTPDPDTFAQFQSEYSMDVYRDPQMQHFLDIYSASPDNLVYKREAIKAVNQLSALAVNSPMVGASGAIYGILMAFALLFPDAELFFFPIPFPIKARYAVILFGGMALFGAIHKTPGDNVAHYAHLGGMLFGWIMVRVYHRRA